MAELRRLRPLLGTFVEVAADADSPFAQQAVSAAYERMTQVQHALSFQDPDSELSRLNRQPGVWVPMSPLALRILRLARAIGIASHDRFNATVAGQLVQWGALPDHQAGDRLALGSSADIEVCGGTARLRRRVLVTLDGIAKGYAVDLAIGLLKKQGVSSGWVNAGGDVRSFGECGLDMLRRELDGSLQPLTLLRNRAIASSYCGAEPVADTPARLVGIDRTQTQAIISVSARRAWLADALTKIAAATPLKCRSAVLGRFGGRLITPGTNP